jgi:Arc/MetJ family transcription regulator
MTDEKANNGNEIEQITDIEIDDLIVAETMEEKFIRNLFLYRTVYEAAIKAGYSETTARASIYTKIKDERFKNKLREYAISNDLLSLPKISYIEEQVLNHLVKNPLDAPKHARMLREKKQIAGILGQDVAPAPQVINIATIEKIQIAITEVLKSRLPGHGDTDTK